MSRPAVAAPKGKALKPSKPSKPTKSAGKKASPPPVAAVKEKKRSWFERLKHLRFARKGFSVHLLSDDPVEHIAQIKRESAAADTSEVTALRSALKAVLDRHASARSVLVHLGMLEKALRARGLKAFDELPPSLLLKAASQLDTLVSDWSPAPLALLRAKLLAARVKQERADDRRSTSERLSDFEDGGRVQVNEASVTTFMEVNEQWERSFTGGHKPDAPTR